MGKIVKSEQTGTGNGKVEGGGGDKNERFGKVTGTNDPKRQQWNKPRKQQQKVQFQSAGGTTSSHTVNVSLAVQPFASVTLTEHAPETRSLTDAVEAPLHHSY